MAGPTELTRADLAAFMAAMTGQWKPATRSVVFRALQQFFGWLIREEEIERSPRERMRVPAVPEQQVPVLTDDQLRAVLATCDCRELVDRGDAALIRLFVDTGCRRGEIAELRTEDVDLDDQVICVAGMGSRVRVFPFGAKTAQALGRWLRMRDRDKWAPTARLWLMGWRSSQMPRRCAASTADERPRDGTGGWGRVTG